MHALLHDLRTATRSLARSPASTFLAVVCFALGIGATSTIFGVVDTLFLRPPAGVGHPDAVVRVYVIQPPGGSVSAREFGQPTTFSAVYAILRDNTRALRGLAAYGTLEDVSIGAGEQATGASAILVSGNYFTVLDVEPALGRFFLSGEDGGPGSPPAAVVSHTFWERRLGADASVIGRTLAINGHPFTVVGVAPPGFSGIDPGVTDVWIPGSQVAHVRRRFEALGAEPSAWEQMVGRLASGVSRDAAQQELSAILQHASESSLRGTEAPRVTVGSMFAARGPHPSRQAMLARWVALAALLVLTIACANVASLLLARAATRRTEIAARLSIGASPWRIVRLLLVESLLLAGLGAGAGIGLAVWGARLVPTIGLPPLDFFAHGRVLAFAAAVAVVCGVLFGMAPAVWATRAELAVVIKGAGEVYRGSRLRATLVVAQVALAAVLLIGAGLFVRSLRNLQAIEPGFDIAHLLRVSGDLLRAGYSDTALAAFYERATQRLRAVPGVEGAAVASLVPLSGSMEERVYRVPGQLDPGSGAGTGSAYSAFVGSDYFNTIGTPLIEGRDFSEADRSGSQPVAIVNEALARREWRRRSPLGSCIRLSADACFTIIGVVANAQYVRLGEDQRLALFVPFTQMALAFPANSRAPMVASEMAHLTLLVRAARDPATVIAAAREALQQLAPSLPYLRVEPLTDMLRLEIQPRRLGARMFSVFGGLALVLAVIGVYGVVSYTVQRRTREMGMRIALGAAPHQVLGLVVRQGAWLILCGLALGIAGGLAVGRLVAHLLFGVSTMDPITIGSACALLGGAGLVAAYVPARRAMRVDPVDALRVE